MRYDTPIYFQTVKAGALDEKTGNYGEDTVLEVMAYANVTDSGVETINLIYGAIRQGIKTIRLQVPYLKEYDYIRIGRRRYRVDFKRTLRLKENLVVSEVQ